MGCCVSKGDASYHGTPAPSNHPRGAPVEEPIPDFGISDNFEVLKLLGEGGSGQTWLCQDAKTKDQVAIKFIKRPIPKVVLPMIMHEIKIQAELGEGHINLVQAREVVLTKSHLGIVMEYAAGGNLTTYVTEKWQTTSQRNGLFLTEEEARYFFKQFLSAVEYLHANHVAHRDLKLDNIVLDDSRPPRIKLCDFGFAKNWDIESNMFTQIGTPVYMSPQLISSKNTKAGYDAIKADVWACGVLLFVMLLGMFPFEHTEHPDPNSSDAHVEVWLQQIKCSWRENPRVAEYAKKLSDECRDMLDKVFELDEKRRIDVAGIKQHPWFSIPMPQEFNDALAKISAGQAEIDHCLEAGHHESKSACTSQRDQALQLILDQAGREATPGEHQDIRIALINSAQLEHSCALRHADSADSGSGASLGMEAGTSESSPSQRSQQQSSPIELPIIAGATPGVVLTDAAPREAAQQSPADHSGGKAAAAAAAAAAAESAESAAPHYSCCETCPAGTHANGITADGQPQPTAVHRVSGQNGLSGMANGDCYSPATGSKKSHMVVVQTQDVLLQIAS